jgi:hypothetical protein
MRVPVVLLGSDGQIPSHTSSTIVCDGGCCVVVVAIG